MEFRKKTMYHHPFRVAFKLVTSLAIFLLIVSPNKASSQEIEKEILSEIHKILKWEVSVDPSETPGYIIAIIEPDTNFIIRDGLSVDMKVEIDIDAYYGLGGLSKVYLSFLYQELVRTNQIRDEISLKQIFPQLENTPWESVNLYQLLTHQSGIPRALKNVNIEQEDPYEQMQLSDIIEGLKDTRPKRKPGFLYSHYNYALLTVALEKITSKEIERLWTDCESCLLLRPTLNIPKTEIIIAPGLDKLGKETSGKDYGVMQYSMGLYATIHDLRKLVQVIRSLDESPLNLTSEHIKTDIDKTVKFSRGLYMLTGDKKYTVYSHSGRTNQHSAAIHFVPQTGTGVVIISNSELGTKDLSLQVLRMVNENWKRKRIQINE